MRPTAYSPIKLLHWERDGFSLYYKRLEKGTFTPPVPAEDGSILWPELVLMLEGIKAEKIVRKPRYCVPEKDRILLRNKAVNTAMIICRANASKILRE
ncbi:MAG: IS66 family insertion sequence element accessory protein TnpB [Sphingobacteriales bacterium]|nr:IS66 family insertion sequence element accessory protein TnpB [Sphingobacteriales bacterium]